MKLPCSLLGFGHTSCAVDGYLIKSKWRNSENNTLDDIDLTVSSYCAPNEAIIYSWP